jgi:hypothetical protein
MGFDIIKRSNDPVRIYAYGMRLWYDTPQEVVLYLQGDQTPPYQSQVAFGYLALGALLAMLSIRFFGKAGRWVLSTVGVSYLAWGIAAIQMINGRTAAYGINLQGSSVTTEWAGEYPVLADATIRFGFYLAIATGVLMLALGIFRSLIEGKKMKSVTGVSNA